MPDRLFTPDEANSALEQVRPAAERLLALRERMRELEGTQGALVTAIGGNGGGYAASDLHAAQEELLGLAKAAAACIEQITSLGVTLKDADLGLVDFPGRRGDEDVELCWHVGEERVEWWHRVGEGFAGRKPIDWIE